MSLSSGTVREEAAGLKEELKSWEKAFAQANSGRKPSRNDIKADPTIAAKYKQYDRLRRDPQPQKVKETQYRTPRRDRTVRGHEETPQKRHPVGAQHLPDAPDAPSNDENFSPSKLAMYTVIGPTPQKDGRVLGLFDCLHSATPQRTARTTLGELSANQAHTPARVSHSQIVPLSVSPQRPSRTPQSTGKRFLLDSFLTPSKRRRVGEDDEHGRTPTSSAKHAQTPSFLRRCSRAEHAGEGADDAPSANPFQRRSFGRSLSSMIRDLRQQQEDKLDEELEALREMEGGGSGGREPSHKRVESVAETQIFGADDEDAIAALEEMEREEQEANEEANGHAPARKWKKKGQKRQTRRVVMRPTRVKPRAVVSSDDRAAEHGEKEGGDYSTGANTDKESGDSDIEDEEPEERRKNKKKPGKPVDGPVERSKGGKRKINPNAAAHANFRSLKIKNKNSKAKGRSGFGRRR